MFTLLVNIVHELFVSLAMQEVTGFVIYNLGTCLTVAQSYLIVLVGSSTGAV